MKLFAPYGYFEASLAEREQVCNGCGPGKLGGVLVPDTFWGLRVTPVCDIHDWMCNEAITDHARFMADLVFVVNLLLLIRARSSTWLRYPRYYRAITYFNAVRFYGNIMDLPQSPGLSAPLAGLAYSEVPERGYGGAL